MVSSWCLRRRDPQLRQIEQSLETADWKLAEQILWEAVRA